MKTFENLTEMEIKLLNCIKGYTEEIFGSDEPMWSYTDDMLREYNLDSKIYRGVISSLVKKGIIKIESFQDKDDALVVNEGYYQLNEGIATFI